MGARNRSMYIESYLNSAADRWWTPSMFLHYELRGRMKPGSARYLSSHKEHLMTIERSLAAEVAAGRVRKVVTEDGPVYIRAHRLGYGDNGWHCGVCGRYVGPPHEDMANCRCQDCQPTPCWCS